MITSTWTELFWILAFAMNTGCLPFLIQQTLYETAPRSFRMFFIAMTGLCAFGALHSAVQLIGIWVV